MTTSLHSLTLPSFIFENAPASILLPIVAGSAVGYSCRPKQTQDTYATLRQPPLRPPPWVFGPAWTVIYGAMGYGAYRAWSVGINSFDPEKIVLAKHGALIYTIQLGLNLIWMPLFFSYKKPILATVDIITLTGTVGYLASIWSKIDERAGWSLAPYLGWLAFANYLCIGCGYLNNWDFSDKPAAAKAKK
ncbi:unnamed protein product [Zymoseptoria tritici ST99CH_3D7]|uniref:TspO/MBR-related protein n=1 Tax=Zymoseptoria tritici (strain ST99CH_3D7) TaxID=1276538 RepID=A0A1X7RG08_ZYMT9|nr:unnamed protein product [Zymoseptoria tritici ST99CH_3D7]